MSLEYEHIYDENLACKKTFVVFRIISDQVDPKEISTWLGVQPSRAFSKNEEYITKFSETRRRPVGHWSISTEGMIDSTSTEIHAKYMLSILDNKLSYIDKYLKDNDYHVTLVFRWEANNEHGGFALSSETLSKLCKLCNSLEYTFIG